MSSMRDMRGATLLRSVGPAIGEVLLVDGIDQVHPGDVGQRGQPGHHVGEFLAEGGVIAVTAFAMKGDEEKIRKCGCEAYIAKPISVTNFLETVEQFLK